MISSASPRPVYSPQRTALRRLRTLHGIVWDHREAMDARSMREGEVISGASRGALPVDVADQGNCISSKPSPSLATLASAATPSKGDTHTHTDGSCSTARAPQTPRDSTSPRRMDRRHSLTALAARGARERPSPPPLRPDHALRREPSPLALFGRTTPSHTPPPDLRACGTARRRRLAIYGLGSRRAAARPTTRRPRGSTS